jgi:hypothetical protein
MYDEFFKNRLEILQLGAARFWNNLKRAYILPDNYCNAYYYKSAI